MLKQAIIVNQDLKMDKGKAVVQAGHGICYYMAEITSCYLEMSIFGKNEEDDDKVLKRYQEWTKDKVMKKIALKATEHELRTMSFLLSVNENIWCYQVHDMGLTQVPENSFTCLVVEPLPEEKHKELFGHLKLL